MKVIVAGSREGITYRTGSFAHEMAAYADALIAVQLDDSAGTQDMIDKARKVGLELYIERHTTGMGRLAGI